MEAEKKPRAWIVPVWTTRLGGGRPMLVCYIAGCSEPFEAQEAVKRHIEGLEGGDVREPSPVSDATANALGVRDGIVWML
jgi:hypothetical protein